MCDHEATKLRVISHEFWWSPLKGDAGHGNTAQASCYNAETYVDRRNKPKGK